MCTLKREISYTSLQAFFQQLEELYCQMLHLKPEKENILKTLKAVIVFVTVSVIIEHVFILTSPLISGYIIAAHDALYPPEEIFFLNACRDTRT